MSTQTILLNQQQRAVAENISDHILLLAGAGTGKTNTLAHRVAHLITSRTASPEEILCLTFTNRACKEMTERIGQIAGEAAQEVTIRTLHSFCVHLLRSTPQAFTDIAQDFTVCDQADCLELIREVVYEVTGRQMEERDALILQNFISLVKDCWLAHPEGGCAGAAAFSLMHRRSDVERICSDAQGRLNLKFFGFLTRYGASITALYNLKLTGGNLLDFSDLLIRAQAILTDPQTAVLWRDHYRYLHVDEVQDVSLAEYKLISMLCARATILLCGDFNQTIYQWRGSDPQLLIERFTQDFSPLTVEFTQNYRSSGQLLSLAQNFLFNAFGKGTHGEIGVSSPACTDVVAETFDTPAEEVDWIYRTIQSLGLSDYSRVAIITRTNKACMEVCSILKASRLHSPSPIRFMLADELRLFKRAEIKDLLACINLFLNPQDSESLKRAATRLTDGIGVSSVNAILSSYKEGTGICLTDFIDPRTQQHGDCFAPLLDALDGARLVVFDVESTGTDVFSDEIIQLAAIKMNAHGEVLERFERFLRPTRPVGASERVHHFSDAFLAEHGEEPQEALESFLDFVQNCVIVGHNVGFDLRITQQNLLRSGSLRCFNPIWYDTLDLSRRFLKKLDNHKLCTVAKALGAKSDPTHNAMDDILATAEVLVTLTDRYLRMQAAQRQALYARHLPRFAKLSHTVSLLKAQLAFDDAPAFIRRIASTFSLEEKYADEPERLANLQLFYDFADDFADRTYSPLEQLSRLLELTALSAGELSRISRTANKVAVITAHQAKGCEFDFVFLPMLQEGVFPTYQAARSGNIEEEKRVFYVSMTRAKRRLFLSYSRYTSSSYRCKPSRFLDMLC